MVKTHNRKFGLSTAVFCAPSRGQITLSCNHVAYYNQTDYKLLEKRIRNNGDSLIRCYECRIPKD